MINDAALFALPLIADRTLRVLYSLFQIGELCAISQDEIARIGRISEASVSKAMYMLAEHGFIERTPDRTMNGGRGGYWIRLLPLPEQEGSTVDPFTEGSAADPLPVDSRSSAPMPDHPTAGESRHKDQQLIPKPAAMDDHDSCQEEKESAQLQKIGIEQDALYQRLMQEPRMRISVAHHIATNPPGSLADFNRDLVVAQTIPGIEDPFYFTVARWRDAQRVVAPKERADERPIHPQSAPHRYGRSAGGHTRRACSPRSHFPAGFAAPAWLDDDDGTLPAV